MAVTRNRESQLYFKSVVFFGEGTMLKRSRLKIVAAVAAGLSSAAVAQAATTYVWQPTAAGTYDWTTDSNWSPNTGYPGTASTDQANFTAAILGNQQVNLDQSNTISNLDLGNATAGADGSNTYTVGGDGSPSPYTLTMTGTSTSPDPTLTKGAYILVNPGSAGDTIAAPITVTDTATGAEAPLAITNNSTSTLTISGTITDQSGATYNRVEYDAIGTANAAGTLVLSGVGSMVGALFDNVGTLTIPNGASITITKDASNCMEANGTMNIAGTVTTPNTNGTVGVGYLAGGATLNIASTGILTTANNAGATGLNCANQSTSSGTTTINVNGGTLGNSTLSNSYKLSISGLAGGGTTTNVSIVNFNVNSGHVYLDYIVDNPHSGNATNLNDQSNITQIGGTVTLGNEIYSGNYSGPQVGNGTPTTTISGGSFSMLPTPLTPEPWMIYSPAIVNVQGTALVTLGTDAYVSLNGGTMNVSSGTLITPLICGQSAFNTNNSYTNMSGTFSFTGGTVAMYDPSSASTMIENAGLTPVTFTNGGGTFAPGGVGTSGNTTITGSYAQTAGTLAIDIGGTTQGSNSGGYDELIVDGGAALGGNLSVNILSGFMPSHSDVYTFMEAGVTSGSLSGAFGNVAVGSTIAVTGQASGSFTLAQSGNNLLLENYIGNLKWTGLHSGSWDTGTQNFSSVQPTAYSDPDNVTFDNTAVGNLAVNIASTVSPTSLTVNNDASHNYSFSGAGISGGASLNKSGTGALTLSNSNNYTGGTNVTGGTLNLEAANALPANSALAVSSGASVVVNRNGSGEITLNLSSLTNAGLIDLQNNAMVISGATTGTEMTVFNQLQTGFDGGGWNGGSGIVSSTEAGSSLYTLGETLIGSTLTVKYAYYGDADLSGIVDGNDYTLIDNGFASGGTLTGWQNGDFNYDGHVDGSDYSLIDNAFNIQTGSAPAALIASNTSEIAGAGAAVPEPASLGLIGIGAMGLLGRRRRQ
jgi:fibronectin-binding autotransporter adhesin